MTFAPIINFFKTAFSDVESAVSVAQQPQVAAIIGSIPTLGPAANTIIGSIAAVEQLIPANGNGAAKKAIVTSIAAATHPTVPPASVSAGIDGIVSALNALQAAVAALEAAEPKS